MTTTQQIKLIIAGLLLALAGTIVYYNLKEADQTTEEKPITPGGTAGVDESDSKADICADYSTEVPATLKTEMISDLVDQYRSRQMAAINASMTDPDAHSVWFDLETIKKFVYHIERKVDSVKPGNTNQLGLRLYYAAYPDKNTFPSNSDLSGLDTNFEYKHTVVMIPTISHATLGNVDFNPLDKNTYGGYISQRKRTKVDNDPVLKAAYQIAGYNPMALTNIDRIAARNHGSLYPPGNQMGLGF